MAGSATRGFILRLENREEGGEFTEGRVPGATSKERRRQGEGLICLMTL
jgi:hypothetical protein